LVSTRERGLGIEKQCVAHLLSLPGWRCLARNVRLRSGEIDIICEELTPAGLELVFVEVRGRTPGGLVDGVESIDYYKRQCLERVAGWFLSRYQGEATGVRFDVMSWNGSEWTHVRNAWFT
jgi:Holliday junction resolvase-like predicted endonuclease